MVLKTILARSICAILLLGGAAAKAGPYLPGEFLMLDLNQAALSPKLLGPPTQFEPVAIEAKTDPKSDASPDAVKSNAVHRAAGTSVLKSRIAAHRPVGRTRTNPLDANAADTRVQVWPCRSGGICNWQR